MLQTNYCPRPLIDLPCFCFDFIKALENTLFYPVINNLKVVVVLPAYNAVRTLEETYAEIPLDIVDEVVLVDDASDDNTVDLARRIGIDHINCHKHNRGY